MHTFSLKVFISEASKRALSPSFEVQLSHAYVATGHTQKSARGASLL